MARAVISGQAACEAGVGLLLAAGEAVWPGEQDAGRPGGGQVRAVAVQAALVDVADQEVGAALVAAFADLAQQVLDRDAGFLGAALAEVVAVGVDEGGPVLRDALQPLGLAGPVIALDGVHGQPQAAGALEQAQVMRAQLVDLLPALEGGRGALAVLQGHALRPAGGMRRDFLPDSLGQQVPQVPAVTDLHRAGQSPADSLAVSPGPVAAHDLGAGVVRSAISPRCRRCGPRRRRRAARSRRR